MDRGDQMRSSKYCRLTIRARVGPRYRVSTARLRVRFGKDGRGIVGRTARSIVYLNTG
jgi:hypothetical protein